MLHLDIPQVSVLEGSAQTIYTASLFGIPSSTRYGNLSLKITDYSQRHSYVNLLLREVFIEHALFKSVRENEKMYTVDVTHFSIKNKTETIIYWLKSTADDVICLVQYMHIVATENREPDELKIESIGKLLAYDCPFKEKLTKHLLNLQILNDVANTYKHSFLSSETVGLMGKDGPTVITLELKYNSFKKANQIVHNHFLKDIVTGYDAFFLTCKALLEDYIELMRANIA